MQAQKIEFRKEREFTSVLGDAIKFLKQNFKPLFLSVILIIGPIILLSGVAYSFIQATAMANSFSGLSMFNEGYFISIGLTYLLMIVNSVLLNSVVFNYMCLYNEKPAGEKITVSEVARRVRGNLGRVLLSMGLLVLLFIVIIIVGALIVLGFVSMGVIGGILMVLAFLALGLIYGPILTYFFSAGFFVVVRDEMMIFSAFGKVRGYLSGNFWWTWLIMTVALIALSILQFAFNLPAMILTMMDSFTRIQHIRDGGGLEGNQSVLLIVLYTIGRFLTTCSFVVMHLVCAFNFLGNEEKHEGKGMIGRIDEIK